MAAVENTVLFCILQLFLPSFSHSAISPLFFYTLGIIEIEHCTREPGSYVGSEMGWLSIRGNQLGA